MKEREIRSLHLLYGRPWIRICQNGHRFPRYWWRFMRTFIILSLIKSISLLLYHSLTEVIILSAFFGIFYTIFLNFLSISCFLAYVRTFSLKNNKDTCQPFISQGRKIITKSIEMYVYSMFVFLLQTNLIQWVDFL